MRCAASMLRLAGALGVFAALCPPCAVVRLYAVREGFRLAEWVGLMDPGGALGGQIMGFNYQRDPVWVHWVVWVVATLLCFGPMVVGVLAIATPGAVRGRATLCGRCGSVLRGLSEPRCPRCGGGFA